MSNPIPSQIALSTIVNGTLADGSVVQANDQLIQVAVNEIIAALSNGAAGQFLKAVDSADVQWEAAASLVTTSPQAVTGPLSAQQLGIGNAVSVAVASGTFAMTSGFMEITSTDSSLVTTITGHNSLSTLLIIRNGTSSVIPFGTGGGTNGISQTFGLPIGGFAIFLWDTSQSLWVCLSTTAQTAPSFRGAKTPLTYGGTVTPNAAFGEFHTVTVNNTSAWTLANPLNPPGSAESQRLTVEVIYTGTNNANGAVTLGNAYWISGTTSSGGALLGANTVATNERLLYSFYWDGSFWVHG